MAQARDQGVGRGLDPVAGEAEHRQHHQQIAGTNLGLESKERADFLMRLDAIKGEPGLTPAQQAHHDKATGELDEQIRLLRSTQSLQVEKEAGRA